MKLTPRTRRPGALLTGTLLVASLTAIVATPAQATASQADSVVTILGTTGDDFVEVEVRADGTVEIQNAPGVVPGTTYSGVSSLRIFTANSNDTVDLLLESSMAVLIDTATGADSVKVEVKAGTSGTMIASIDASTSTNSDTVEIKAESNGANLDISASHSMSTNDDKVIMEVNGQGSADWLKAKLVAKDNSGDNAEMIVTSDARNVTVGYGVAPTFYPPTDWNPNGFSVTSALATSKLIVEHKATTGTLLANLSVLAGNSVVELKGTTSKVVTGTVGGNQTTLFAEGPASGSVVTTGTGSLPKCIVNVGTSVNCTP